MEFKKYRRTAIAEMTEWEPELDITGVSISQADLNNGSPKIGDMIARNPENHNDKWLVAAKYFADNFEPMENELTYLIIDAIDTDGGHHKQWFLEQIAEKLEIELPEHEPGIAP